VVTALGLILAVSLGSLGLAPITFLRQLGIAFAISPVLDTFVIRTFYFPAMIKLLAANRKTPAQKTSLEKG
jgi:RND superfamily putative drug exporter